MQYTTARILDRLEHKRYRISSSMELPFRLQGEFTYEEAYNLTCEWNRFHSAREMAVLEEVKS
jgi:hypothetical protein